MDKYITEKMDDFSIVDKNTGELYPYMQTRKIETKEFIMVFLSESQVLMDLTGNQLKILICCWEYATYSPAKPEQGNIVFNGPGFKELCRKQGLTIPNPSIDNAISQLTKKNLLIKKHRGEYMLNPQYFFKGKLADRNKVITNNTQKEQDK